MFRKILFLACAAILVALATTSQVKAWYTYHYGAGGAGFHYGGGDRYGGFDRYGGGGYHYGYHYGGYGGGYHYGYARRW
jgi:hypothetical protein